MNQRKLNEISKLLFLLITFFSQLVCRQAKAETVNILKEVEIGVSGTHYLDPEFEPSTFQVAFYGGVSDVYLGAIDPTTGHFVNHDYTFIDSSTPIYITLNGPEWGSSQAGTGIYYTKSDSTGFMHTFRYLNGEIKQLDSGRFGLLANYPSKNSTDPSALVMGALFPDYARGFTFGVFSESNPSAMKQMPIARIGKGPRFVIGERKVVTNMIDKNKLAQLALFDFDSGTITQSTFDGDDKDSGFTFLAPELGNEMILIGVVNRGKAARVYRKVNSKWQKYVEIPMNSNIACNLQAFSYKGKSYISFNRASPSLKKSNDVVIASIDGKSTFVVSDQNIPLMRFDPETLESNGHLFVYYYDLLSGRLFLSDVVIE